ncbi:MAG: branched-chain amino acid ABC transporter permease [Acidimicrobiales bacterium]
MSTFLAFTVIGLCTAGAYAIAASGLVLTYTTTGIFNFAHGAIGMLMAFMYWELAVNHHWPQPLALAVVLLVIAPLTGLIIERVLMRKLASATPGVSLAVTLGLLVLFIGIANARWPSKSRFVPQFFNGHHVQVFGVAVTYHKILMFGLAAVVALMLRLLLFGTRIGVAMRAVVDDPELASLNGMKPVRVSQLSWALSASLAGLAGILLAPDLSLDVIRLTFVVVVAYSAAIVGRLKSLPLTFLGAVILGLADAYAQTYIPAAKHPFLANIRPTMPAFLLFAMLLILPAARLKPGRAAGRRNPRVPGGREALLGAVGLVVVSVVASHVVNGAINLQALNTGMATALIVLSLVILTGYGGQFSLAQMAFAGIGVVVFQHLGRGGSPLALVACAGVCAAVGAVVAFTAVRLQGLYLALATLAFALLADQLFFANENVFGGSGSSATIHHLKLPGIAVRTNHGNLILLAVVFALFGMGTLAIRRGQFGRTLSAMSDSDAASATLGLNLTLTKVAVFALSAAMAGVAGALYGGTQTIVGGTDFYYVQSLILFLMAYIGGVNTVSGALIGGMALGAVFPIVSPHLPHALQQLTYLGTGLGAVTIARQGPSGIVGLISGNIARLRPRPVPRLTEGGPVAAPAG